MSAIFFKTSSSEPAFTTEVRISNYEQEFTIGAQNPSAIRVKANFMQTLADYVRPAENTLLAVPEFPDLYFVDDVNFRDIGGGVQTWTRLWANIPDSWNDAESYAYEFPGFLPGGAFNAVTGTASTDKITFPVAHNLANNDRVLLTVLTGLAGLTSGTIYYALVIDSTNIKLAATSGGSAINITTDGTGTIVSLAIGRLALTWTVTAKIVNDYFLVGTGGSYSTPEDIPVYFGQRYIFGFGFSSNNGVIGGIPEQLSALTDLNGNYTPSSPALATYKGDIATDAATPNSYSIEAADSVLKHYLGNIWVRQRRFVKAI